MFESVKHFIVKYNSWIQAPQVQEKIMDEFIAKCRICKTKFVIPDMGPCTDLEFKGYIRESGFLCKCGKNEWQLMSD